MTEQAVIETSQITTLAPYGDRSEVKELATRIHQMLPGGMHYTDIESLTLAQIGIAHDLDPFNGEVWLIKSEETGKVYGALIGIKGLRKHAKKQANYWGAGPNGGFTRITDPKTIEGYGASANALVYEYRIMDEKTIAGWTNRAGPMRKMGFTLDEIIKMLGPAPYTLGVGIFTPGEKTKMKPHQVAMYRAEKDALKRRFDVRFRVEIGGETIPMSANLDVEEEAETVEGEYDDFAGDEPQDQNEILEELGYTPKTEPPSAVMSLEMASDEVNRDGKRYGDLELSTLQYMEKSLKAAIEKNGLEPKDREDKQRKLDACRVILANRK